jgi:hypothetical protein
MNRLQQLAGEKLLEEFEPDDLMRDTLIGLATFQILTTETRLNDFRRKIPAVWYLYTNGVPAYKAIRATNVAATRLGLSD